MDYNSNFFAYINRMKYINRWQLMRNSSYQNIMEHSAETAQIAFCLAEIKNKYFDGNIDSYKVATIALFHDMTEVMTGDLPTPVKYYDENIKNAYKKIENIAEKKLLSTLPEELKQSFEKITKITEKDKDLFVIAKVADTISAYIKCLDELKVGNNEFKSAKNKIKEKIDFYSKTMKEVDFFIKNFLKPCELTLDQISL